MYYFIVHNHHIADTCNWLAMQVIPVLQAFDAFPRERKSVLTTQKAIPMIQFQSIRFTAEVLALQVDNKNFWFENTSGKSCDYEFFFALSLDLSHEQNSNHLQTTSQKCLQLFDHPTSPGVRQRDRTNEQWQTTVSVCHLTKFHRTFCTI